VKTIFELEILRLRDTRKAIITDFLYRITDAPNCMLTAGAKARCALDKPYRMPETHVLRTHYFTQVTGTVALISYCPFSIQLCCNTHAAVGCQTTKHRMCIPGAPKSRHLKNFW